jgi:predicted DNA-binding transcriptional regulator AlpA
MYRSFISVKQAAKQLGCSESRIYSLINQGRISGSWTFPYPQKRTVNPDEIRKL